MNVVFFPSPPNRTYEIEVCGHRLGKKMTYTEDTDTVGDALNWIMTKAVSCGIKYSLFTYSQDTAINNYMVLNEYKRLNQLWLDVYFWTPEASEGAITRARYEEYREKYHSLFKEVFEISPVAFSYSYGNTTFSEYAKDDFIGARNSGASSNTDYGIGYGTPDNIPYSKNDNISKPSTTRWYNGVVDNIPNPTASDFLIAIDALSLQIDDALNSGGWFNNFTHIRNVYGAGQVHKDAYEDYFDMLAAKNVNNEIYFAGYGEAVAYLAYKQMVKRGVMYSPSNNPRNELIIRLETDNSQLQVNTDLLVVPISVKFSTSGTPLEGLAIRSDRNIISLGNNQYIIEIPWSKFPVARIEKA